MPIPQSLKSKNGGLMFSGAPRLLQTLLTTDLRMGRKYPTRMFFTAFQIILMMSLFWFISETLGEIAFFKSKYFPFVATGLAFQYFLSGVINAASGKFEEYRDYGLLEEILFSRYSVLGVMLATGFYQVLLALFKALVILSAALWAFELKVDWPLLALSTMLTFLFAMQMSLIASCSFLLWKRFSLLELGGSVVTLLFTGVYFPVSVLPFPLNKLAELNPAMHGLRLFRQSVGLESGAQYDLIFSAQVLLGATLILLGFNFFFYRYCIRKIKEFGLANQF